MNISIVLLFSMLALTYTDSWQLKKSKDGIEVFTRSVQGAPIDAFRTETRINNATLDQVLTVITDVDNYETLFPDCTDARILQAFGKYNTIHYMVTKAPFPVSNRDGIYKQETKITDGGRQARIELSVLPDYLAHEKGLVRIPAGSGHWALKAVGKDVKVAYEFLGDPGGSVPAWLANAFIVEHPFKTMENLRMRVNAMK